MKNKKEYKVGDRIVEFGEVFRIYKIKNEKNKEGKINKIIYFKPCYLKKNVSDIFFSIPECNIIDTNIRKPISIKVFKQLNINLKKKDNIEKISNINTAKELLKSNDPTDTVELLKSLWKEKISDAESFSKSKKDIYLSALDKLVQEFALVSKVSLDKARDKINLSLKSS